MFPFEQNLLYSNPQNYTFFCPASYCLSRDEQLQQMNAKINAINSQQESTLQGIKEFSQQLQTMSETLGQAVSVTVSKKFNDNFDFILQSMQENPFYPKTHLCPHHCCDRRYSSNIALRAHLKKKHGQKAVAGKQLEE